MEYLRRATVSALSLHAANPEVFDDVYFLIPDHLEQLFRSVRMRMPSDLSMRVRAVRFDPVDTSGLFVDKWASPATYGRLFLPDLVDEDVSFLLYLDADTMVVGDVSELAPICQTLATSGFPFAAVAYTSLDQCHIERLEGIGVDFRFHLSAGVLLMDLNQWRQQEISNRALEIVRTMGNRLEYWDQDALNILQGPNYLPLAGRYNNLWWDSMSNPSIIHYAGKDKPGWRPGAFPADAEYWQYLRATFSPSSAIFFDLARKCTRVTGFINVRLKTLLRGYRGLRRIAKRLTQMLLGG